MYSRLFQGIEGIDQHLNHAGTDTGRPDLYFPGALPINLNLPAYDFLNQFMFSLPSQNYRFSNPDKNFNEKLECKCSN